MATLSSWLLQGKWWRVSAFRYATSLARFGSPRFCHIPTTKCTSPSFYGAVTVAAAEDHHPQFKEFQTHFESANAVREKIRSIVSDLENATRLMHAHLLLLHHTRSTPEILNRAKVYIESFCSIYHQLADVIKECPGQYYRYHDHWRYQTSTVVFLLAFLHWLETGMLISHKDIEAQLALKREEFGVDLEDYLIGLCNFSNELPRYVVNQVTAGDYDCPRRVSAFLSDLYTAFRMLNLRNDTLRKRFDAMKYDVKKVEEILYDVKIRGLLGGSNERVSADRENQVPEK